MALKIEKMISGCRGLGHEDGKTVIVDGALVGEEVEYTALSERKGVTEGEVKRVLSPSPLRIEPICPLYGKCGGCSFQIVGERDSALLKEEIVKDNMLRVGGLKELPPFLPPSYSESRGYRIRCRVHVDLKTKRQGFLARSSNTLVEVGSCPLLENKLNALLSEKGGAIFKRARSLMFENRVNRNTGFVEVPMFSGDSEVSMDESRVDVTVGGIKYSVTSSVFFQSNPAILEEMLKFVKEYTVGDSIMDLYSGVGTFSALFNGEGKSVYAVEREKKCLALSRINAPSAISFTDDCALWAKKSGRHVDTVIVDPPRVGLDRSVPPMIEAWKPERIIYVSCNPVTLSRDLSLFAEYKPVLAKVFDGYYGSEHVETCVLLVRERYTDAEKVSVKVDMDGVKFKQEKYLAPEKATYPNIKKWVMDNYGLSVSSLYIAQVKDKLGLEKRKNYNLGSGEGRVPNCPPEKEEAIKEALKHFDMI